MVTRAELDEALLSLRKEVDAELQTFKTELTSMVDALAGATITCVDPPSAKPRHSASKVSERPRGDSGTAPDVNGMGTADIGKPDAAETGQSQAQKDNAEIVGKKATDCGLCPFDENGFGGMNMLHLGFPSTELFSSPTDRSASNVEVRDYVATNQAFYAWCNTLWDASTFVGTKTMGAGASIVVCGLLALAIFTQVMYIWIIEALMVPNPMSDKTLLGLQQWRQRVAHDVRWIDPVTGESLATRVCSFNYALELSTTQKDLAQSINAFLPEHIIVNGPVVCLLAIGSFLTVVVLEIRICAAWILSLYPAQRASTGTQILLNKEAAKKLKIESISRIRFASIFVLGLIRFSIAVSLGYVATRYLVYTSSVKTLFLMAMKFAFVLNVDELLFQAFLPHVIKVFLSAVAPLPAPHRLRIWAGIDRSSVLCIIACAAWIIVVKFVYVDATAERLEVLTNTICGGNKEFVYVMNPTSGAMEWTKLQGVSSNKYLEDAVKELVDLPSLDVEASLSIKTTLFRVKDVQTMGAGQQNSDQFGESICDDRLDFYKDTNHSGRAMAMSILSSKAGYDVTTCNNISSELCDDAYISQPRALCSRSCGCGNYRSGLFANGPSFGCGASCFSHTKLLRHMQDVKCVDMTQEELRHNFAWKRYWLGMEDYRARQNLTGFVSLGKKIALERGCPLVFASREIGADFCTDYLGGSPLTAFCPITCGCGEEVRPPHLVCPPKCDNPFAYESNGTLRFDNCSDVVRPGRKSQCSLMIQGTVLHKYESIDSQCCDSVNGAAEKYLATSTIDESLVREICCIPWCIDQITSVDFIRDLLFAMKFGPEMCFMPVAQGS